MKGNPQPPQRVPVLTEVVVLPKAAPEADDEYPPLVPDPAYAETAPAPLREWPPGPGETPRQVPPQTSQQTLQQTPQGPRPVPPAAAPEPAMVDEALLTQRVLADLDKQLDLMFEHRLRETLAPVLARTTDTLVREMRNQLAVSLREMVARAVSLELDRLQKR